MNHKKFWQSLDRAESVKIAEIPVRVAYKCIINAKSNKAKTRLVNTAAYVQMEIESRRILAYTNQLKDKVNIDLSFWERVKGIFNVK